MEDKALLVTGSRLITNRKQVFAYLDEAVAKLGGSLPTLLIHGGAPGVDQLSGAWAAMYDIPVRVYHPDFNKWPVAKYRWQAYTKRDYLMVDKADLVVAIWNGKSGGTKKTKEYARKQGKLYKTFIAPQL